MTTDYIFNAVDMVINRFVNEGGDVIPCKCFAYDDDDETIGVELSVDKEISTLLNGLGIDNEVYLILKEERRGYAEYCLTILFDNNGTFIYTIPVYSY